MNSEAFFKAGGEIPKAAIFMSGSGSNAEKLLGSLQEKHGGCWQAAVIVTDAPGKSRAREIAAKFGTPLVEHDIKKFYAERGEARVSLMTENGRRIRGEWTDAMRKLIAPFKVDFGLLAGFVPLTNICADFPCLNVHPGDLTVEKEGRRVLVGLHTIPVETAILRGFGEIRSSVIVARPYTGKGGEMDSGPILGISEGVKIDLMGRGLAELRAIFAGRPPARPPGGFKDELEDIAKHNQCLLKENGDWTVFPAVAADFAAGKFRKGENDSLLYLIGGEYREVKTVIYAGNGNIPVRP